MKIIYRYWRIITGLAGAAWYVATNYRAQIRQLETVVMGALSEELSVAARKRLKQYVPAFLVIEYLFALLQQAPLTEVQRQNSMFLSGLTPFFDDLTDDSNYSSEQIQQLLAGWSATDFPAAKYCAVLFQAGGFEWNRHWQRVVDAQLASRLQLQNSITDTEIHHLTIEKGGASVLLGWQVIADGSGGAGVEVLSLAFGGFAQLLNDIFDIWKDREAGVRTLATTTTDFVQLTTQYQAFFHNVENALQQTPYSEKGKLRVQAVLIPLYALGLVALHQLRGLELPPSGAVDLNYWSRKQLVCDMARWGNRFRWAWYILGKGFRG